MSSPDFGARALASQAVDLATHTFATLALAGPAVQVRTVSTAGHTEPGLGAAEYVSDLKAGAALQGAHPAACFVDRAGRWFRLAGTADGFVTPEMLGCPAYTAGQDQRPFIQAAIDYAKAVGLNGVYLTQPTYELWAPPRTGDFADNADHSGCFLVIDGFACALVGKYAHRTTLHCKGPTGGSLATDYQVMHTESYGSGDVIWRGHGIKLTGTTSSWLSRPGNDTLSHTVIRDIILRSDAVGQRNTAWPAFPPSRDPARENCWDISNKGIYCQQDRHIGDLALENVDIIGFLGECVFAPSFGANENCRVTARNIALKHSNGQALNPNGMAAMEIDGLYAENCSMGIEGWFGYASGRLTNAYFRKCNLSQITGGSGYDTPLRADGSQPILTVSNVVFDDCGDVYIGSYVHGNLTLIDSRAALVALGQSAVIRNTVIDVTAIVHRQSNPTAIRYAGAAGASQAISNTQVRLTARRSRQAVEQGYIFNALWSQSGSLGPRNYLYARGEGFGQIGAVSAVTDNYVAIIDEGLDLSTASAPTYFDPTLTPAPDMASGAMRCGGFSSGNGVHPVNLPSTAMYPHNAEISLEHRDAGKTSAFVEVLDGTERKALLGYRDRTRWRCNRLHARWEAIGTTPIRTTSATVDLGSISQGAESGPYTITAPGCRPHHYADVQSVVLIPGAVISAIRPENDAIRFWVRNIDGATAVDPPAGTFRATWGINRSL